MFEIKTSIKRKTLYVHLLFNAAGGVLGAFRSREAAERAAESVFVLSKDGYLVCSFMLED